MEASGPFSPGQALEVCLGVSFPGNGGADPRGTDDSWPLRRRHSKAIVKLSLFLEGLGHGQPYLQELRPQRRRWRLLQLVRRGNYGHCPPPSPPSEPADIRPRCTSVAPSMESATTLVGGGGRSNLQPPFVSNYPSARNNLPPPFTPAQVDLNGR